MRKRQSHQWGESSNAAPFVMEEPDMEIWHVKIVETIYQLERIFPLFLYSIEHLVIHLPYKAKMYAWIEEFNENKAHPKGSICGNYTMSEISYFILLYFEGELETR
ncbi:hypothetical protein SLEP1_g31624 [Rubroshorea leprosula]|uniref:DUF4218 domain-containing protein n=1 Tax=Rubroshorea leprosula TaxID=152421 RepID=A0AAV5KAM9_9ROSI|nr:hypothetical protein SLEP1_g31624 [Rubroshorea leprosula]